MMKIEPLIDENGKLRLEARKDNEFFDDLIITKNFADAKEKDKISNWLIKIKYCTPENAPETLASLNKLAREETEKWKAKKEKEKQELKEPEIKPEIKQILQHPDFLSLLVQEVGLKVIGEQDTIKTLILCASGIFVDNASLTSYNDLINDESGSGKDFIATNVLALFPKERVITKTRISPKALNYWHTQESEPAWTWDGKVLYLKDISNEILNSDAFKLMCSDGSSITVVIDNQSREITIKGKPIIFLTSYSAIPNKEMRRRFQNVTLDTSEEQTKKIMQRLAEQAEKGLSIKYDERLLNALACLKRVKVKIPYAHKITAHLPSSLIMRTHYQRFIDYIKASSSLHQYQRETDKDKFLIANDTDYKNARDVLIKTTSTSNMTPLTKKEQAVLNVLKNCTETTVKDLENGIRLSKKTIRGILNKLIEEGLANRETKEVSYSDRPVDHYSYIKTDELKIPSWEEINDEK